jgi:RHS repeat-associated protein
MERDGDRFHYFYDGRGSADSLTDEAGDVMQQYGYDPYGRLRSSFGSVDQPFRWNGYYALNDFAYKVGARWYDASLGRWTQLDPSGADPNAYLYAGGDPINNADPSGLELFGIDCPFGETDSGGCNGASSDAVGTGLSIAGTVAGIAAIPATGGASLALTGASIGLGAAGAGLQCGGEAAVGAAVVGWLGAGVGGAVEGAELGAKGALAVSGGEFAAGQAVC